MYCSWLPASRLRRVLGPPSLYLDCKRADIWYRMDDYSRRRTRQNMCVSTKFAIAQGNWIGQLPEELHNMTYGSRSLIRPMQSFGRLTAFYNGGGMRLTGHVYSNK